MRIVLERRYFLAVLADAHTRYLTPRQGSQESESAGGNAVKKADSISYIPCILTPIMKLAEEASKESDAFDAAQKSNATKTKEAEANQGGSRPALYDGNPAGASPPSLSGIMGSSTDLVRKS